MPCIEEFKNKISKYSDDELLNETVDYCMGRRQGVLDKNGLTELEILREECKKRCVKLLMDSAKTITEFE